MAISRQTYFANCKLWLNKRISLLLFMLIILLASSEVKQLSVRTVELVSFDLGACSVHCCCLFLEQGSAYSASPAPLSTALFVHDCWMFFAFTSFDVFLRL